MRKITKLQIESRQAQLSTNCYNRGQTMQPLKCIRLKYATSYRKDQHRTSSAETRCITKTALTSRMSAATHTTTPPGTAANACLARTRDNHIRLCNMRLDIIENSFKPSENRTLLTLKMSKHTTNRPIIQADPISF